MPPLRIIPLRGLGEIGLNLLVLELEQSAIVINAGLMFPNESPFSIDYLIPDFTYLLKLRNNHRFPPWSAGTAGTAVSLDEPFTGLVRREPIHG